jgi:hypothetical protein
MGIERMPCAMHADRLFAKATMRTRMLLLHLWRKLLIVLTSTSQIKLYGMSGTDRSANAHYRRCLPAREYSQSFSLLGKRGRTLLVSRLAGRTANVRWS